MNMERKRSPWPTYITAVYMVQNLTSHQCLSHLDSFAFVHIHTQPTHTLILIPEPLRDIYTSSILSTSASPRRSVPSNPSLWNPSLRLKEGVRLWNPFSLQIQKGRGGETRECGGTYQSLSSISLEVSVLWNQRTEVICKWKTSEQSYFNLRRREREGRRRNNEYAGAILDSHIVSFCVFISVWLYSVL